MHNQIEAVEIEIQAVEECAEIEAAPSRFRQLAQRGLTTIEYALGLMAAATLALLLFKIFAGDGFGDTLLDWVTKAFAGTVLLKP